ncbi:MAG: hypothetical protein MI921_03195 [Cytophagales bacterium]|nr:hypothetical protein [Cytophagales bacterium]
MKEKAAKTYTSYREDVSFLNRYTEFIRLSDPLGNSKVANACLKQRKIILLVMPASFRLF